MNSFKRILAALTLLIGTVVLFLSLAGCIGVWMVKGPATARTTRVFERIGAAAEAADRGLGHVEASLANAAERLESAKQEQEKLAREPQTNRVARRLLAEMVQRRIGPRIDDANAKLHKVAEAAVLVNSVLEDLGTIPFPSIHGLDLSRLEEMNARLADVGPAAWELSRLLGDPAPDADAVGAQLSRIEKAMTAMRTSISEYRSPVTQVRQRTEALKSGVLAWITPASILISALCLWIALSQVSLLAHAWSWWKHARPSNPRPL
jgi:hypothetical protein